MDVSIILASNKPDTNQFLSPTINSIINYKQDKYEFEVVLVTPNDIKIDHPNVRVIKDYLNIGCSHAYNLGIHAAHGRMMTLMTDDWYYASSWTKLFDDLLEKTKDKQYQIIGTIRTKIGDIPSCNTLTFTKDCINTPLFGGNLYNPGMFHQYLEMDVVMLLNSVGVTIEYSDIMIGSLGEHRSAWHNKQRFFKADEILFRYLWGEKLNEETIPKYPSYEITYANEQELNALVDYQKTLLRRS